MDEDQGMPTTAMREVSLLKDLDHPNVVQLLEVELCVQPYKLYLVFEWVDRDLRKYMLDYAKEVQTKMQRTEKVLETNDENKDPNAQEKEAIEKEIIVPIGLPPRVVQIFLFQLLKGIDFCHSKGIMHRDLKPQNILIDGRGQLKVADFGLARSFLLPMRTYTHEVVTLWYRAPEVLMGARMYSLSLDVWSVATIFAEMSNGHPVWPGDCEIGELFTIFQSLGTPTDSVWPGFSSMSPYTSRFPSWKRKPMKEYLKNLNDRGIDLFQRMVAYNHLKRISCRRALHHPYFDKLISPDIMAKRDN